MGLLDTLGKLIANVTASASSATAAAGKTASYSGSSSGSSGTSEYNAFSSTPKQDENSLVQTDFQNDFLLNDINLKNKKKKQEENKTYIGAVDYSDHDVQKKDNGDGTTTYEISGFGTKITVSNKDAVVQTRINKDTNKNELYIKNGKDVKIESNGNNDLKYNNDIVIEDSEIDEIKTSKYDDNITINNSTINKKINSGDGNDNIFIKNSKINDNVETGNGDDELTIEGSTAEKEIKLGGGNDRLTLFKTTANNNIFGESGSDKITVKESSVKDIKGDGEVDAIVLSNSTAENIFGGGSSDQILIKNNSNVNKIYDDNANGWENFWAGSDKDTIVVDASKATEILAIGSDNEIGVANSKIGKITGGGSKNSIVNDNSRIGEITGDHTEDKGNVYEKITSNIQELDEESKDTAVDVTSDIASKYLTKENPTETEKMQAIALNFIVSDLDSMKEQFENRDKEDGWVSDGYNLVKQLTSLGISNEDIKGAIDEQEKMVKELTEALNGESDETFEECFERWTGTEYNQEDIQKYYETSNMYQLMITGINKGETLDNAISKATNLQEVFDAYLTYYGGDEDKALEEINRVFNEALNSEDDEIRERNLNTLNYPAEMKVVEENGQYYLYRELPETVDAMGAAEGTEYKKEKVLLSDLANVFPLAVFDTSYADKAQEKMEDTIGISMEDLQTQYATSKVKAFGNQSSFEKVINEYCEDQEGFKDKLSQIVSTSGMIMIVGGAVVCCACPPASGAGMALISAGQKTALVGMLSDEGLELIDEATSGNMTSEELDAILRETVTDLALYYSGKAINVGSGAVNASVLESSGSKVLAKLAEIGVDAPMSLMADYIITGDVDFTGEGMAQLMSIVTGIAGGKIQNYNKSVTDEAFTKFNGDTESQVAYMKAKGLSTKTITDIYSKVDTGDVVVDKDYIKTNSTDVTGTLSKQGIEINDENICHALTLKSQGMEITSENIKVAQDFETKGIDVTAENIATAKTLKANGVEVSADNVKVAQKLEANGLEVNFDNMSYALKVEGTGAEVTSAKVVIEALETNKIATTKENITTAQELMSAGANVTQENIQLAQYLKNNGAEITATTIEVAKELLSTYGGFRDVQTVSNLAQLRDLGLDASHTSDVLSLSAKQQSALVEGIKTAEGFGTDYDVEFKTLQNGVGTECKITLLSKELQVPKLDAKGEPVVDSNGEIVMTTERGSWVDKTITIDENGNTKQTTTIRYADGTTSTRYYGSETSTDMSGNKPNWSNSYSGSNVDYKIETVVNDTENYILYTKASTELDGAYEVTKYNLDDYPEDMDVVEAIKSGTITGGEKLSTVTTSENGVTTYNQSFTENGTTTNRNYSQKVDSKGNITSNVYTIKIEGENGESLLSLNRVWTKNANGTTTTVINDKSYITSFDDANRTVTITDEQGSTQTLDFNKQMSSMSEADSDSFWQFMKKLPSDQIEVLSQYKEIELAEALRSQTNGIKIWTEPDISAVSHENGHAVDGEFGSNWVTPNYSSGSISGNSELIATYNEEWAQFKAEHPEIDQSVLDYLSQTGGTEGVNTGLNEFVAESYMLLTTYGNADSQTISTRAYYLLRYFPKTFARVAELMHYNF